MVRMEWCETSGAQPDAACVSAASCRRNSDTAAPRVRVTAKTAWQKAQGPSNSVGPELSGRAGGARGAARLKSRCSRRPPLLTTASRVVSVAEEVTMVTSFGCASESAAMAGIAWPADAELRYASLHALPVWQNVDGGCCQAAEAGTGIRCDGSASGSRCASPGEQRASARARPCTPYHPHPLRKSKERFTLVSTE